MSNADVSITIDEIVLKKTELHIAYAFANKSSSTVFLYNLLADRFAQMGRRPSHIPRSDLGQTCLLEPSTAVVLLGPAPTPNHGPEVTYLGFPKPSLSRVKAGKTYRATIRAKLPLVEWSDVCEPQPNSLDGAIAKIEKVRLVAIYVYEADARNVERHPFIWTCYDLTTTAEQRTQTERDISDLGLTIATNPWMPRFE